MFNGFTIHVGNIKRSVRSIGKLDGTEPVIGGSQKFVIVFIDGSGGHRLDPLVIDEFSMHQITARIPNKYIAMKFFREGISPINRGARRRGYPEVADI